MTLSSDALQVHKERNADMRLLKQGTSAARENEDLGACPQKKSS